MEIGQVSFHNLKRVLTIYFHTLNDFNLFLGEIRQ